MQRIYLPNTSFWEELIISEKELYHQITRVMRARVGQEYVFFSGVEKVDYLYEISDINKNRCVFHLKEKIQKDSELKNELTLYQALPNKLSKLETIVQKCCEIGYKKIVFFQGDNSQKLVLSDAKKHRLEKIAIEAIEQCSANYIPSIHYEKSLEDCLQEADKKNIIFCHTEASESMKISEIPFSSIGVVIGPEWGLSEKEAELLEWFGAKKVCFWTRVFRCETVAPLVWFYFTQ